jgi:uncharacterized protein YigA (DUF484 family)
MSSPELDASQVEREQLVAQWLLSTPGFFERHAELLTQMELANSHSGRAVSLQEKQMHVLRNQNRDLNRRLSDMLRFGSENDKTQSLMVQWLEGLLATKDEEQTRIRITEGLNELFEIGQVKFVSVEHLSSFDIEKLQKGICCGAHDVEPLFLSHHRDLTDGSFVALLLRHNGRTLGVVLMLSADKEKFLPEMRLVYLEQLGNLAAAALSRFQVD